MASINYAAREISVKIVYYGPGLSGKTTNLQIIHRKVPKEFKSDMVSLATETDRTLFFDFLPLNLGKIKGFTAKFQLYTVPGQVYYSVTRKLVLRGVDGIVFVADSASDKINENIESFQNMEENLAEYGYKREEIPIIIQYNKRDVPTALPIDELQRRINKYNLAYTEAVAMRGEGVFESLKLIGKTVIDELNRKYAKKPSSGASPASVRPVPPPQGTIAPSPLPAAVAPPPPQPSFVPPQSLPSGTPSPTRSFFVPPAMQPQPQPAGQPQPNFFAPPPPPAGMSGQGLPPPYTAPPSPDRFTPSFNVAPSGDRYTPSFNAAPSAADRYTPIFNAPQQGGPAMPFAPQPPAAPAPQYQTGPSVPVKSALDLEIERYQSQMAYGQVSAEQPGLTDGQKPPASQAPQPQNDTLISPDSPQGISRSTPTFRSPFGSPPPAESSGGSYYVSSDRPGRHKADRRSVDEDEGKKKGFFGRLFGRG